MVNNAQNILLFCIAASAGALARYGLGAAVGILMGSAFPWGIFVTNVVGCLLFGMVWALTDLLRVFTNPAVHVILLTGFMGAFTTFSSFIYDSQVLLENGQWWAFAGNMLGQLAVGLAMMYVGVKLMVLLYGVFCA